jgi:DNA-3-methyladenine glycosylase I
MMTNLVTGDDGRSRCAWGASDPLYLPYHDDEWGRPLRDERALFELLTLEAFQSGLSWLTILRKRPGFRAAFDGFDVDKVAAYGDDDRARLLADPAIVRNGAKVDATIANARATVGLHDQGRTLVDLLFSHAPPRDERPAGRFRTMGDIPASTPSSTALAKELRSCGFRFVGPVVAYALMQAAGVVDDHLEGCWVAG